MTKKELKVFLDEKVDTYNQQSYFLKDDPILLPQQFSDKKDIEIIAFLVATIAWGKRPMIIKNGQKLIDLMGGQPHDFLINASTADMTHLDFVHRTFNSIDLQYFLKALQEIYKSGQSIEDLFNNEGQGMAEKIANFRTSFFAFNPEKRTQKHVSNPLKNSSAKRLNMFLRWMVRNDNRKVDFGIWTKIKPSELYCPLDIHTGNVARKLGLIKRRANDWKALEELMVHLRRFDKNDPVKYDFALFGLGVYENF